MNEDTLTELRNAQQLCRSSHHVIQELQRTLDSLDKLVTEINNTAEKLLEKY